MAINAIRDFNFVPSNDLAMNQTLLEIQATLMDMKMALINLDKRLSILEEGV